MIGKKGLVAVTFRGLTPQEIIQLASKNGLSAIEWGGDVHVPPSDLGNADDVKKVTRQSGLDCVSYGSYYRLCWEGNAVPMEQEVACAKALGVENLRVWAGSCGSGECPPKLFSACVQEALQLADLCQQQGMTLSFEYHQGTLTDTADSALALMKALDHPSARLYWQPNQFYERDWNLAALEKVLPYVSNVHVFSWSKQERLPLRQRLSDWRDYLALLQQDTQTHHLLLEFIKNDAVPQFEADCKIFLQEF